MEKGNANGVMIAYTRWGCTWSGGSKPLVTGILREEWGCDGLIITDNVLTTYVNGVDGVFADVSTFDAMLPYVTKQLPDYKNDAVIVNAMREACHRNLYAIANSSGMNGIGKRYRDQRYRPFSGRCCKDTADRIWSIVCTFPGDVDHKKAQIQKELCVCAGCGICRKEK